MKQHPLISFEPELKQVVINSNSKILELDQKACNDLAVCLSMAIADNSGAKHSVVIGQQTLKCRAKKSEDNQVIVHINLGKFHLLTSDKTKELVKFLQTLSLEDYQELLS